MAPIFLFLALVIQCSFIHADIDTDVIEDKGDLREALKQPDLDDEVVTDFQQAQKDWLDILTFPNGNMLPPSSAAIMAKVTNSNKTLEEQVKEIQEIAQQISFAIETEMINLFSYAMAGNEKEIDENGARKRRSVETPMDSTEMVMRLLRHIKSNNEYQNIAIEKMMTAQEIAEKFGIEFNPDPEILSDLAMAANEHAQEMTTMLKKACDLKNVTQEKVEFIPVIEESKKQNETYYVYSAQPGEKVLEADVPSFEYQPDIISKLPPVSHAYYTEQFPYYNYPYESQIPSPPVHHHTAPVSPKPSFYDPFTYPFTPASDFYSPYYTVEPIGPVIMIPFEDPEPEPELVGEEVEETISSKMFVARGDEPGSTTVNHVTSYTISEKSHFKPPQIEKLPQHFQYSFFLM